MGVIDQGNETQGPPRTDRCSGMLKGMFSKTSRSPNAVKESASLNCKRKNSGLSCGGQWGKIRAPIWEEKMRH